MQVRLEICDRSDLDAESRKTLRVQSAVTPLITLRRMWTTAQVLPATMRTTLKAITSGDRTH